ncbi:hypothetical protein K402DRAFT_399000, partial [Aulographum hederae CBS 113979]
MMTPATRLQPTEPEDKTRADMPTKPKTRLPKTRLVPICLRNRRQDSCRYTYETEDKTRADAPASST